MANVYKIIKNISSLAIGFIVGAILELIMIRIYNYFDPKKKSNLILALVVLLQLFVLFYVLQFSESTFGQQTMAINMGFLASQLYIFDFALKKCYDPEILLSPM